MYSVVMMMAMSASPEVPEFGGGFLGGRKGGGCCSSSSCSGYGGGCSGYNGGCSGYGGGCSGYSSGYGRGGAGYSSCSGYGIYGAGCSGSHHQGTSWMPGYSYSPYGCSGSHSGSVYGSYSSCSGYGIYGAGGGYSFTAPSGCYGSQSQGCAGSMAVPYGLNRSPLIDANPAVPTADRVLRAAPAQATVVIKLPADAKLFAQNQATELTSAVREFVTPALEAGQSYQYTFRAEFVRESKPVVVTRELVIQAGDRKTVEFADEPKMDRLSVR